MGFENTQTIRLTFITSHFPFTFCPTSFKFYRKSCIFMNNWRNIWRNWSKKMRIHHMMSPPLTWKMMRQFNWENVLGFVCVYLLLCCHGRASTTIKIKYCWKVKFNVVSESCKDNVCWIFTFSDALLGILSDGTPPNTNLANVVLKTLSKIQQNVDIILDLQAAEYVVDMSKTLIRHLDSQNAYNDYVMNICEKFLSKNWTNFIGSELRTAESNALLDKMLQFFFKDSKISFLRKQLIWISSELKDFVGKNSALKTFPCFKKYVRYC